MYSRYTTFIVSFLLVATLFLSGCIAPILIGGALVVGYAASKDTVTGNLEATYDDLWLSAVKSVSEKADIIDQNTQTGIIKARRGDDTIAVKIRELTEHSQNLRVSSRKSFTFANLTLAQEIFTKIIRNLDTVD